VWRVPGRAPKKFFSFAHAEQGSMKDLHLAARLTSSPRFAALYLKHALDESRHCAYFSAISDDLRKADKKPSLGSVRADIECLFETLGEVNFLAFVHRGERRGCTQFESYRDYFARRGNEKFRALFSRVIQDELRHESYTKELLIELTGSEQAAKKAIRRMGRWEAWRTWRRMGRSMTTVLYNVCMGALYVSLAPISLLVKVVRPERAGWQLPEKS
jgi:hypothetical protein